MKKIITALAIFASSIAFSQVGIGTNSPHSSSILDLTASDKAVLLPRVASVNLIAAPVNGMIVYDISSKCVRVYEDNKWTACLTVEGRSETAQVVLAQIGAEGDNPDTVNSVVTADQLNLLGLDNVVAANETAYQDYIDAYPDNFSNPATYSEVGQMLEAVNVAAIVADSNVPADGSPSIADLTAVGLDGMNPANLADYEEAIANASPTPTTLAELQAIINIVEDPLGGLIASATYPAAGLTETQFANAGATGLVTANVAAYEAYIAVAEPQPTDLAGLQAIINEVNTFITANSADVVISLTGAIWMNKNLGASQVATSSTDAASYGNSYQWGKAQAFTSAYNTANNAAGPVASAAIAGTNFITNSTTPYDWISVKNNMLWNEGTESAPIKSAQDPCPTNYRVPTETELNNERLAFSSSNASGAFASSLKFPTAGFRNFSNASILGLNTHGNYWSSMVSGTSARNLFFNASSAGMNTNHRTYGFSVRCIKE